MRGDHQEKSDIDLAVTGGDIEGFRTDAELKSIYHDVDRALYSAKKAGKNRVVVANAEDGEY